jgi:sugar lactone lactonase YvrE
VNPKPTSGTVVTNVHGVLARTERAMVRRAFWLAIVVLSAAAGSASPAQTPRPQPNARLAHQRAAQLFGAMPLLFEKNQGQVDARASFISHASDYTLFLTGQGATIVHAPNKKHGAASALRMEWLNASAAASLQGDSEIQARSNYLVGQNAAQWHASVPNYQRVKSDALYPGIDLVYYGKHDQLEYDLTVAPGADPNLIQLHVEGARRLHIDKVTGDLLIRDAIGSEMRLRTPVIYQQKDRQGNDGQGSTGERPQHTIAGRYVLSARNTVSFAIGDYDRTQPLVIDPYVTYSTVFGGSTNGNSNFGENELLGMAVDGSGNVYLSGITDFTNLPTTAGAYQPACNVLSATQCSNFFVAKFNPNLSGSASLVYATYLGGTEGNIQGGEQNAIFTQANDLAVDASGDAYLTGFSSTYDYPTTSNAYSTVCGWNGSKSCFGGVLSKLNPTGTALLYSTYFPTSTAGGNLSATEPTYIAIDAAQVAYIAGTAGAQMPTTDGSTSNGYLVPFIAAFDTTKSGTASLVYSEYLSLNQTYPLIAVAADPSGNAYLIGDLWPANNPASGVTSAPITLNGFQTTTGNGAGIGPVLLRLNHAGTITYATYVGSSNGYPGGYHLSALSVDASGNAYVGGDIATPAPIMNGLPETSSITAGAYIAKVNTNVTGTASLLYSTFVIANDNNGSLITGIANNSSGLVSFVGQTVFAPTSSVVVNPIAEPADTATSQFVGTIDTTKTGNGALTFLSYVDGAESLTAISFDPSNANNLILGGLADTGSVSDPFLTTSGTYASSTGKIGAPPFFYRLSLLSPSNLTVSPSTLTFGNQVLTTTSASQAVTVKNTGTAAITFTSIAASSEFAETDNCQPSLAYGASCTVNVTFTPSSTGLGTQSGTLTLTDSDGGSPQTVTLTGTGIAGTPLASLTPNPVAFGNQAVGVTSNGQVVVLSNTGTAALNITGVSISGTNPTDFSFTSGCGTSLAAGSSCNISVNFTPASAASFSATLSVADNASGSPQSVTLTGTGKAAAPQILFVPATIGLVAGLNGAGFAGNGGLANASTTQLDYPVGLAYDSNGNLFFADAQNYVVRRIDAVTGIISTFAGTGGTFGFSTGGGVATSAQMGTLSGLAIDSDNNVYVADRSNNVVWKITTAGAISIFAGSGTGTCSAATDSLGDGCPAVNATFSNPWGLNIDASGNLYISDSYNNLVREIASASPNIVTIFAGVAADPKGGTCATGLYAGSGPNYLPTQAHLCFPEGVAFDANGNAYIADSKMWVIREINKATGYTTVIAGNGTLGTSADGTAATSASLRYPTGPYVDAANRIYFTDGEGSYIRLIDASGNLRTVYGTSSGILTKGSIGTPDTESGSSGYGAANGLTYFMLDTLGNLVAAQSGSSAITSAGTTGQYIFPQTGIFITSAAIYVTVENPSSVGLTFSSAPTITGPFALATGASAGTCNLPGTLASGQTCTIGLTFTPTVGGTSPGTLATGTVTLNSNAPNSPNTILLSGYGYGTPTIAATFTAPGGSTGANFTSTPGVASAPQAMTLTNTSQVPITLGAPLFNYNSTGAFTVLSSTCPTSPATLAVNASCVYNVTFTPLTGTTSYSSSIQADVTTGSYGYTTAITLSGTLAAAPIASLAPAIAFPSTIQGKTATAMSTTLANTGTAALTISSVALSDMVDFSITVNTCGTSLAAGSTCTISVTFTPAAATAYTATLTVTDNAATSTQSIAVTGTGLAATPTATLTGIAFPNQAVGTTNTLSATLTNSGTGALTLSNTTVTGSGFALATGSTCTTTLAAGSSCSINVTFSPTAATAYTGTLTVTDNATGSPQTATLTGTGTAAQAVLSPTSLTFPSTTVGATSSSLTTVLSNPGTATLTIGGVTLAGANAADFTIVNGCGATLAAGAGCNISATFTPLSAASFTATISVADSATGSPQTATLTGTGTPTPVPIATLSPASVAFGNQNVGTTSNAQTLTLSNTGTAPLAVSSITLGGGNPTAFTQTANTCGATVSAGTSCTISYTFAPATAASDTATVSVSDNAAGSPQTATLTGTGVAPGDFSLAGTPSTQTVNPGATASYNINVAALNGGFGLPITLTVTGLPTGATASFTPATVTPGTGSAIAVLTVQTSQQFGALRLKRGPESTWLALDLLPLLAALGFGVRGCGTRRRKFMPWLAVLMLTALSLGLSSCAGGYFGPPPQTFTLNVAGTSASTQHSTTVTLTVQ